MADETPGFIQRWAAKRRVRLVGSILKGDTSVGDAARQQGLTVAELIGRRTKKQDNGPYHAVCLALPEAYTPTQPT